MTYFVMIMLSIILFLFVLALYRLHTIDEIQKDYDKKVEEVRNKYWKAEEEKAKLRTFKMIVENLVTGMRTDKEVREKIKELISRERHQLKDSINNYIITESSEECQGGQNVSIYNHNKFNLFILYGKNNLSRYYKN